MGVSAEYEVDAGCLLDETFIACGRVAYLPAEVGEAYHDVALLLAAQDGDHAARHGDRVEILGSAIVGSGHESLKAWGESEHSDSDTVAHDDGIWFYDALAWSA